MGSIESLTQVAEIVKSYGKRKKKPVVVVSAMSGVTDTLIDGAHDAMKGHQNKILKKIAEVGQRHLDVLLHFGLEDAAEAFYDANLQPLFDEIVSLLNGVGMLRELSPRSLDLLSSFGERLSSLLLTFILQQMGVKAQRFDTREILRTDSSFGDAQVDFKVSKTMYRRRVLPVVKKGAVPVLTGFIGSDSDGNTTTLGRGGSDYSASIAAILLGAKRIEIWTDVDGMLSANPRDIKGTKLWQNVSFQEAAELAYSGAKVLHPKTIHPAVDAKIDVVIKNTFNPKIDGTVINQRVQAGLKGIATTKGVSVVYICSDRMLDEPGFVAKVSGILAKHGVSIDVITTSEVTISVSLNGKIPKVVLDELGELGSVTVIPRQAKLCLVGSNVCSDPKFLAMVFKTISKYSVHMISFGASNINLTLIVDEKDCTDIARKLHKELFVGKGSDSYEFQFVK